MAKFCTNCGKEMDSDATFCVECGTHNKGDYKSGNDRISTLHVEKEMILPLMGFILSFVFSLAGLIVSIIALIYSKKHNEVGKRLAVAGIATSASKLSYILVILIMAIIRSH